MARKYDLILSFTTAPAKRLCQISELAGILGFGLPKL